MKFEETYLNDNILDALYDMKFEEMTPIQEKCIPEILDGHDVLGVAQTGTGKTAAYLLPILSMIDDGSVVFPDGRNVSFPQDAINCVIMSPTRELAQQIDQAMQGFSYYLNGVSSIPIYGGNDGGRYEQEHRGLTLGADVIIATPGRLISHLTMGNADFSRVSFFVLDEADRMLDMGFSDDILKIAKLLPPTCQTVMFSATMPQKIEELAKTLLKNPVEIKIAVSKPAEKIQQSAYLCFEPQKIGLIKHLFKNGDLKRVIIFGGKKQKVKTINRQLQQMGINSGEMHSDLEQAQRDEMMYRFKSGQIDVLVATDIVSRGIDIDDIAMVINYDVPHDAEDYVHRIGRTARAERDGVAITFISDDDIYYFNQIERLLEKEVRKEPLPDGMGNGPEYRIMKSAGNSSDRRGRGKGSHGRSNKKPQEKKQQERKPQEKRAQEQKPKEKNPQEQKPKEKNPQEQKPKEKNPQEQKLKEKKPQEQKPKEKKPKERKPQNRQQQDIKPQEKRQTEKVSSSDEIGKKRHNNKRKKSTNPSVRQQPPTPRKPTAKPTNEAKTATKKPTGLKEILAKPLGWLKKITGSER